MIKNTHKAITDYAEAIRQANEVHKQAVNYIEANYVKDSALYNSAMKTASDTFRDAIQPLKDNFKKTIEQDFEDARKAIQKAVSVPPSDSVLSMIPLIRSGKMTETELKLISGNFGYMDTKLLYDAMGKERDFTTVESVLEELDSLEEMTKGFFSTYAGEGMDSITYKNALMLNGSMIKSVDDLTDGFVSAYTVQDSNK